jgi:hypothetical protein
MERGLFASWHFLMDGVGGERQSCCEFSTLWREQMAMFVTWRWRYFAYSFFCSTKTEKVE